MLLWVSWVSLLLCILWVVLSSGLTSSLFPSKVNTDWELTDARDSSVLLHLVSFPDLIIWPDCTVTGLSGGPFFPQWQEGLSSVNLQSSLLCYFQSSLMSCSCRWCFSLGPANMPPIQPGVGIAAFCKMNSQFIKYVQILDFIMCWPVPLTPHGSLATSVKSPPTLLPCPDQLMKLCRNQPWCWYRPQGLGGENSGAFSPLLDFPLNILWSSPLALRVSLYKGVQLPGRE